MTELLERVDDGLDQYRIADDAEHTLTIPDGTGDTSLKWTVGNAADVAAARAAFDAAKGRGMLAYAVKTDDVTKGEVINTFDETLGQMVLTPQQQGG